MRGADLNACQMAVKGDLVSIRSLSHRGDDPRYQGRTATKLAFFRAAPNPRMRVPLTHHAKRRHDVGPRRPVEVELAARPAEWRWRRRAVLVRRTRMKICAPVRTGTSEQIGIDLLSTPKVFRPKARGAP